MGRAPEGTSLEDGQTHPGHTFVSIPVTNMYLCIILGKKEWIAYAVNK